MNDHEKTTTSVIVIKPVYCTPVAVNDQPVNFLVIVGVNKFIEKKTATTETFRVNDKVHQHQAEKMKALRAKRDNEKVKQLLQSITKKDESNTNNLMSAVIEAVENYCTLGEIADMLRKVW